jgi:hypothetical protein
MHGRHCSIVIYYKENILKLTTYGQAKGNFALVGGYIYGRPLEHEQDGLLESGQHLIIVWANFIESQFKSCILEHDLKSLLLLRKQSECLARSMPPAHLPSESAMWPRLGFPSAQQSDTLCPRCGGRISPGSLEAKKASRMALGLLSRKGETPVRGLESFLRGSGENCWQNGPAQGMRKLGPRRSTALIRFSRAIPLDIGTK